jgi:hypothetical protein
MIPLKKKEVWGWLVAYRRFAIRAVREVGKGEASQGFALIPRA